MVQMTLLKRILQATGLDEFMGHAVAHADAQPTKKAVDDASLQPQADRHMFEPRLFVSRETTLVLSPDSASLFTLAGAKHWAYVHHDASRGGWWMSVLVGNGTHENVTIDQFFGAGDEGQHQARRALAALTREWLQLCGAKPAQVHIPARAPSPSGRRAFVVAGASVLAAGALGLAAGSSGLFASQKTAASTAATGPRIAAGAIDPAAAGLPADARFVEQFHAAVAQQVQQAQQASGAASAPMAGPDKARADLARLSDAEKKTVAGLQGIVLRQKPQMLTVLSDPLCPACRDFERQLAQLDPEVGIRIIPVAFQRGADARVSAILCSGDPAAAWKSAVVGDMPAQQPCDKGNQAVTKNNEAFIALGATATPTLIAPDGTLVTGGADSVEQLNAFVKKFAAK